MADPKDAESTEGNGHDQNLPPEDVEAEYVYDEIYDERFGMDNGHEENPVPVEQEQDLPEEDDKP